MRQFGRAEDLLLPFRLQGSRADDKRAFDILDFCQKLAGGKRLNGFSKSHVVGQKRSLAESEMEHSFPLVGKERKLQDIEALLAAFYSCQKNYRSARFLRFLLSFLAATAQPAPKGERFPGFPPLFFEVRAASPHSRSRAMSRRHCERDRSNRPTAGDPEFRFSESAGRRATSRFQFSANSRRLPA